MWATGRAGAGRPVSPVRTIPGGVSGFTLMEVLAVLAIVSIMLGFAAVALAQSGGRDDLEKARNEIVALVRSVARGAAQSGEHRFLLLSHRGCESALPGARAYRLENGVGVEWRMRGREIEDEARWEFTPSGLCQPVSCRLSRGTDYIELEFSPLAGTLVDERSSQSKR